jgi:predicted amidophosphoribosyltransferase
MKINVNEWNTEFEDDRHYLCPLCDADILDLDEYCHNCSEKIEWIQDK